jgi:hypothetical protein
MLKIVRAIGSKLDAVHPDDVEMLVRFAFVLGYAECGREMYSRQIEMMEATKIDSASLAASANQYAARFVANRLCVLTGLDMEDLTELMREVPENVVAST